MFIGDQVTGRRFLAIGANCLHAHVVSDLRHIIKCEFTRALSTALNPKTIKLPGGHGDALLTYNIAGPLEFPAERWFLCAYGRTKCHPRANLERNYVARLIVYDALTATPTRALPVECRQ